MADPGPRTATYDDVVAAPDHLVAELIDGALHLSPRPSSPHARAATVLGADLDVRFSRRGGGGPGGWWILYEPELHLGVPDPRSRVLVPDLAGWRRERMPEIPRVRAFDLAPDWVCQVLSPSPAAHRRDRILKLPIYAERGVGHVWILDPEARTLEVLRLHGSTYLLAQLLEGDRPLRAEPFEAVELDPTEWWLSPGMHEPGADPLTTG